MGYRRNECTLVLKNRASIKYTTHKQLTKKRFMKEREKKEAHRWTSTTRIPHAICMEENKCPEGNSLINLAVRL
jgi:hypothetical protein